ncbi:hypothetical protein TH61_11445 [Rufibacter sp. DG15C]|uniref:haloacid dehalogenase-like hydrolase n=1 Tax=Rufibacter sp. DG15C TaxID=1379909 RepID=UPI00078BE68E|nr:HAD family hydrolase [Rufibacter sp. DG15C]AMM51669.1 hypothetical protein TH61_11445 [Rufibacter sp. DG15C]
MINIKPNFPELSNETELFVFDICDTLFLSNTTFDFIEFALGEKALTIRSLLFKLFTKRFSPIFLCLYILQKVTKVDWPKKLVLNLLKGFSKKELYTLGKLFEQRFLPSKKIEQTHQMLNNLVENHKKVVLVSASIDPVVSAIAFYLGVPFLSSMLEYDDDGLTTGNLTFEMTGKKLENISQLLSFPTAKFAVATDNFSDRSLVEAAHQRFVIIYNTQARLFWQELNPYFIEIQSK